MDDGGGVGDVIIHRNAAHNDGDVPRGSGNAPDGGDVVRQKRGLEQQILRRIAGHGQLREGYQVGAGGPRIIGQGDDAVGVAGYVADGGVELGQSQAEDARHNAGIIAPAVNTMAPQVNSVVGQ